MKAAKHNTGRLRRFSKWAGASLSVLLLLIWIGSGWYMVGWESGVGSGEGVVYAMSGGMRMIYADHSPSPRRPTFGWRPMEFDGLSGQFICVRNSATTGSGSTIIEVPIWFLGCLCALPTAALFYFDRRARFRAISNTCPHCAFDLTGLAPDAVCPECGKAR